MKLRRALQELVFGSVLNLIVGRGTVFVGLCF